ESSRRNSEALVAMGLVQHLTERWDKINQDYLASNRRASDAAGGPGAISKVFQLMLRSAVLGVGAYLVIYQQASAGIIIAGAILSARAGARRYCDCKLERLPACNVSSTRDSARAMREARS